MIPALIATATLTTQELPYAQRDLIFQSPEAVERACSAFESSAKVDILRFIELSQKGIYTGAYQIWSDLLFRYFSLQLELGQVTRLSSNEKVKDSVQNGEQRIGKTFEKMLQTNPRLMNAFLQNAEASSLLTPQERLFTENILKDFLHKIEESTLLTPQERLYKEKNPKEYEQHNKETSKITELLEKLSTEDKQAFATANGLAKPINPETLSELKVLSANILCFPGTLNYTYGGASPWKERIDRLIKTIIDTQAQIVCLQEVWDPAAMRALIEHLKNDYAFFIYDGGDPAGTLDPKKMGYSSGLFVASKLELDSVAFRRFPRSIPEGSNRGAFIATCRLAKERLSFVNTHLQHGNTLPMREIRQEQLLLSYAYLQEAVSRALPNRSWGFLTGDLNINAFSPEFNECGLSGLFSIPYTADLTHAQPTYTDYFNDLITTSPDKRDKVVPTYELLDYCIAPACLSAPSPVQAIVPLYNIKKPTEALSDHQALLTTWTLIQNKGI